MSHLKQIIKETLISEGYFKDLAKKSFKKNKESMAQKAQYIDDIFDELKKQGLIPGDTSLVKSKAGREYPIQSPQGKMIMSYGSSEIIVAVFLYLIFMCFLTTIFIPASYT